MPLPLIALIAIEIAASTATTLATSLITKALTPTPESGRLGQNDFHTIESGFDLPLPKGWGADRFAGNITWIGPVREHKYNIGGNIFSDGVDVFYYTQDVEYTYAMGPAEAFIKIYLNDKVVYDASAPPVQQPDNIPSRPAGYITSVGKTRDSLIQDYELFLGTETQEPSRIVTAVEGGGNVPADRGFIKAVFKDVLITQFGSALPPSSAEIQFADFVPIIAGDSVLRCSATSHSEGGDNPTNTIISDVTNNSGKITRHGSHPLAPDPEPTITWSNFLVGTGELPPDATITGIFPVVVLSRHPELGVVHAVVAGQTLYVVGGTPGDPDIVSHKYIGTSIGTNLVALLGQTASLKNDSTINVSGVEDITTAEFIGFEVHYSTDRVPPTGTTLAAVVADLCEEAGLTSDQYDVNELVVYPVRGFKTEQKAIRDVMRELMSVYPFDGYESDGKLKFVLRSGEPSYTVPEDDLVLAGDEDKGYRLSEPFTQEDEIPMKAEIHYPDFDRAFQDNVQYSKRIVEPANTMESITVTSISTNVVFNANEAAQAADRVNWEGWATRRAGSFQLLPKHLRLDPADKLTLNYKGYALKHRLKEVNLGAGLGLELASVSHDPDVFTSVVKGSVGGFPVPPGVDEAESILTLLDAPYLFDEEESAQPLLGYAFSPEGDGTWPGGVLYKSSAADFSLPAAIAPSGAGFTWGRTTNALGAPATLWSWDDDNELTVELHHGDLPESASEAQVLDGANLAALVKENGDVEYLQWVEGSDSSTAEPDASETLSDLQALTNWIQDGNNGDTGGGSPRPNGTFIMTPGSTATFSAAGAYPFNNSYWYTRLGSSYNNVNEFTFKFEVQLPTLGDYNACRCVEFELQKNVNDVILNMAWQANLVSGKWRYFNKTDRVWVDSSVSIVAGDWNAGAFVAIEAAFSIDGPNVTHVSLKVNGTLHAINVTQLGVPTVQGDYLNAAFQLDSNGLNPPTPYIAKVRNMDLVLGTSGVTVTHTVTLSRLIRGRRGTEGNVSGHAAGEIFIILPNRKSVPMQLSERTQTRYFKGVTMGDTLAATETETIVFASNDLKPYAPVHIEGARAGDDLTLTWIRRTRVGGEWFDLIDVPLSEASERYEVDIIDSGTVVRTISSTSPSAAYSAADQTADFGSPQDSIDVNVYQISDSVGRGFAGSATV